MTTTHLGAAIVAGIVPLPVALATGLWLALAASLYDTLGRHGLRLRAGAVTGLALGADDACQVERRGAAASLDCRVVSAVVVPFVVLLQLRCAGRRPLAVVLAADAVEGQAFRRLRARLRLRRAAG